MIAATPFLLLVHPSVPATTVKALIALARAKPGEYNYAAGSIGAASHLSGELFKTMAGVNIVRVPFRGTGPGLTAVLGAQVHMMFAGAGSAVPHVQSGRLRALGFTGSKRYSRMPDVPLISEAGVPDYVVDFTWNAWYAPARTPSAIASRLQGAVATALKSPKLMDFLDVSAFYPVGSTPEEFRAFTDAELKRYAQHLREAKVPMQ